MTADEIMSELGDFPEKVATPVGQACAFCGKSFEEGDRGRIIQLEGPKPRPAAYHRDCLDEATSLGIGG
jgi:hypothetical protein